MFRNRIPHAFLFALVAGFVFVGLACDTSEEGNSANAKSYPPVGSRVDVQFRRDYLGLDGAGSGAAGAKPIGVMGEGAQVLVASSGELKKMTEEFLVLQVDNEPNREIWIPRAAILMMDVKKKQ